MLNEQEKKVLFSLEELSASSLNIPDQAELVSKINELLQALHEETEAAQLLNKPSKSSPTFVKICRKRLIEAQKQSLENYEALRISKTRQLTEFNDPDQSDPFATKNDNTNGDPEDKLTHSMHESKSESITQILQRMRGIAQGEILRGEMNIGELDMSSRTLRELQEKYSGVSVLLNGSKRLVKLLDEAEKWDRWCMLASLGFLAFVMLYIIYRRILSGPVKILMWSLFQLVGLAKKVPTFERQPAVLASDHKLSSVGATETIDPHDTVTTHAIERISDTLVSLSASSPVHDEL